MRVLIATGLYPPEIGGPATYTRLFEKELPAHGCEVEVLPFSAVRHFPKIIRHITYAWELMRLARSADVLLAQDTVSVGFPAAVVSKITGIPLVVRVPGDYAWEQGRQRFGVKENIDDFQYQKYGIAVELLRFLQKYTTRTAIKIIVPSKYLAGVISQWGSQSQKIEVVYNGVELSITPSMPEKRPIGALITSVGRLVPWKGFRALIDMVNREPDWFLAIIGDGPEKEVLENEAGKRVRLKGSLPREEMLGWCKVSDAFVLNSSYEGLSHTLLEVMSLGVPVVATNVGGNGEVIENGVDGMLVEHGDEKSLHDAIKAVLNNKTLARKLGKNAKKKAELFSIDHTVKATKTILESALYTTSTEGTRVLMISSDRNIFEKKSDVRRRMSQYGSLFDELHIIVSTKKKGASFESEKISDNVWVYPTNSYSKWFYVLDAVRIGKKMHDIDIVTAQDPFELGAAGALIAKKLQTRLHIQVHTDLVSAHFKKKSVLNRIRIVIAKWVIAKAHCIRSVSKRVGRGIEIKYRPSARVSTLPIYVDVSAYTKIKRSKRSSSQKTFIVVSRLEREKNVGLAITALYKARQLGHNARLVIVGSGSEEHTLRKMVNEWNLTDYVEFVGWQDPKEYYSIADLVLVTSRYEGYGMVIVEALAAGVPVLSTDVGVAHEAGAIIAKEENFSSSLVEWINSGPRKGVLKHSPYKNEAEYLQMYKEDIMKCI